MNEICIFCKIAQGSLSAQIAWSDDHFMAFHDIHPKAPLHVLVIPKMHVSQLSDLTAQDSIWLGEYMLAITNAAKILNLTHYKVQFNNGIESGQEIFHLHAHLLQYLA
jgi:histidine triad (HIT) family protein